MGIPAYFKYLTKTYPHILEKSVGSQQVPVQNLFMDCNSIVYDAVHSLSKTAPQNTLLTNHDVIEQTIFRIHEYIEMLKPQNTLFIAFDGVAPLAKMNQQKTRRHKGLFVPVFAPKAQWDTTVITPGTPFMRELSASIQQAFSKKERSFQIRQIVISTAEEKGEGEHKLFAWLRRQPKPLTDLYVYGMDADLIMLALLHLPYVESTGNIRVFREYENRALPDNPVETVFLNSRVLADCLVQEMGAGLSVEASINDYIFMCFFLGNDFMPHFPSMNIRTHGIPKIIEVYNLCRKKVVLCEGIATGFFIDRQKHIQWANVSRFIQECAKHEHEWLLQEYAVRDKQAKYIQIRSGTDQEKQDALDNIPLLFRAEEFYICPTIPEWQDRYYKSLFNEGNNEGNNHSVKARTHSPKQICQTYLEGLAWTWNYYSADNRDWRWTYPHHYPPLFQDLRRFFQEPDEFPKTEAYTPEEQLAHVMPKPGTVITGSHFRWAFCRYLWEAHLVFPPSE